jgi:hypothetical protein
MTIPKRPIRKRFAASRDDSRRGVLLPAGIRALQFLASGHAGVS